MSIKPPESGIFVVGIGGKKFEPYPAWRYHEILEPIIVQNTEEDAKAREAGWFENKAPITAKADLVNWRTDLEDMNAEQLVLFILEEFGIELPMAAGEEKLMKAVWELMQFAPQFKGRICLLAQTIEMDYDEEVEWIKKAGEKIEMEFSKEVVI